MILPVLNNNVQNLTTQFEKKRFFQYGDLYETIRKNGRIEEPDAAIITLQVASALNYLHERNVVHRDVKPENLLLVDKFSVKLCDFGLACHILGPLYRICGTPTYCAPEVLRETGYSTRCDIWSLGVVLYVMLVGYAPFRAPDQTRLFKLIMQAKPNLDMPEWKGISLSELTETESLEKKLFIEKGANFQRLKIWYLA